ncbi:MAG: hypothetical protein AAFY25_13615 [Pseudomonadota bacterium]
MTERRIEGSGVDPHLTEGLAAPVADPLWFLARQWQVGEFRGEDAAQPMIVEAIVDSYAISDVALPGQNEKDSTGWDGTPLETMVERTSPPQDAHARAQSGLAALRSLRRAGASADARVAFREAYPVKLRSSNAADSLQQKQVERVAAGAMDGLALWSDLKDLEFNAEKLPVLKDLNEEDVGLALSALNTWVTEEETWVSRPDPGVDPWNARTLDHSARIAAVTNKGAIVLSAPAYAGGRLEWYDFDLDHQPKNLPPSERRTMRTLVSPLRFAGQPAARWWEIEEGDTYFGDLAGGPDDVARSVLASFAAVGGDDWFVIPVTLPTGRLAQVKKLRVYDNFSDDGVTLQSTAQADQDAIGKLYGKTRVWQWTELSPRPDPEEKDPPKVSAPPLLLLLPATNTIEQGRPIERVTFKRDEMANLAWAIERVVPGPMGRGLRNSAAWPGPPPPTDEGVWRFELGTKIPQHWYPMVPVRLEADQPAITLRRGVLAHARDQKPQEPPAGELLGPGQAYYLDEAALPSGGVEVGRRWQMVRSADGRAHLWLGRERRPSSGPMERTPLEFDRLSGFKTENRKP